MGLKPYDRKISQIFNNVQYDVDFYQREYKWSDGSDAPYKPVASLLKDIFYRFDLEPYNPNQDINEESTNKLEWYYLNTFMTNLIKGKKYIVDGQQRLTTLSLVSIGLYHLSNQHGLPVHIVDSLKSSIVGNTEFGTTYWMGFKDRKNALDDILKNHLDFKNTPSNISERNIYANYKLIFETLNEKFITAHKLQTFIAYLRHRVYLIEIEIDKDKDVAMVFEVINDRGIPLNPYEILKGKILSQIDISDRDKYIDIWEKQIQRLEISGEQEIDNFFGFYFRSKYAENAEQYAALEKTRYHKSIFTMEFDKKIGLKNNEANARTFVERTIPYYIEIYLKMLKYYYDYDKSHEYIYFNALNDIDGQFILTLSAISAEDTEAENKLKQIPEYFDKLYCLLNLTASYKSNEFNTAVISLNTMVRDQAIDACKKHFDSQLKTMVAKNYDRDNLDEALKYEFFKNIGYTHLGKTFLRYFFARIDHFISDFSDLNEYGTYYQLVEQTKGGDVYHIEHILTNREENQKLFVDEEEFNLQRNRLGDLLLLKGRDNQSSNDELYPEKLKTYNVIGTYYARTLLPDMYNKKIAFREFISENKLNFKSYPNKYAKTEIEERQQLLFELSKRIWS